MGHVGADNVPVNQRNTDPLQANVQNSLSIAAMSKSEQRVYGPDFRRRGSGRSAKKDHLIGAMLASSIFYLQTKVCAYYERRVLCFGLKRIKGVVPEQGVLYVRKCWIPDQPKQDRMTSIAFSVEDSAAEVYYQVREASRRIW